MLFLSFAPLTESAPRVVSAPGPLPHVSKSMERPEFWARKIKDPDRLLLRPGEVLKLNQETLEKPDLYLCRVKDLKEEWSRQEIDALLKEDWDVFGSEGEVRYGKGGTPLKEVFWDDLRRRINRDGLSERTRLRFGLIVKKTDIRVFPTEEPGLKTPSGQDFDRFQHSSLSPGTLVGVYYFSSDNEWAYIQSPFIRGWARSEAIATGREKNDAVVYHAEEDRLVVTGNSIRIYGDPSLRNAVFSAQMGDSFPLTGVPGPAGTAELEYVIKVPFRERDGSLSFRRGYVSRNADVSRGVLPYNQGNACRQVFKMLDHPYSWGERYGGRDCSRLIMDLFACFGIIMPRNSMLQARIGIDPVKVEGMGMIEKAKILDRCLPFATTLRLPGHIMLYIGKDKGRHYAIHSIWGIETRDSSGSVIQKIGKTIVTDLELGHSGPSGSLLHRISDIRVVAAEEFSLTNP
jgi:hypothetical protein